MYETPMYQEAADSLVNRMESPAVGLGRVVKAGVTALTAGTLGGCGDWELVLTDGTYKFPFVRPDMTNLYGIGATLGVKALELLVRVFPGEHPKIEKAMKKGVKAAIWGNVAYYLGQCLASLPSPGERPYIAPDWINYMAVATTVGTGVLWKKMSGIHGNESRQAGAAKVAFASLLVGNAGWYLYNWIEHFARL